MKFKTSDKFYNDFIKNIKKYLLSNDGEIIFEKRNIIKKIQYKNKTYIIKSFKIPHFINKIVYRFFRKSKAQRSYENSLRLMELGINTPKPIGFIELNSLFLFKESYYVCEFFDYDFEIKEVFNNLQIEDRETILKEFVKFTYDLHNKGVYHIDYSPGNILVKMENDKYLFYIIDVNRMKFLDFDIDLRMKSMQKLTQNSDDINLMLEEYSKLSQFDIKDLQNKFHFYIEEQKKYLEKKKKLKQFRNKK